MRKISLFLLMISIFLCTACGSGDALDSTKNVNEEINQVEDLPEQVPIVEDDEEVKVFTDKEVAMGTIRSIPIGATKDNVIHALGKPNVETTSVGSGKPIWRYDIGLKYEYTEDQKPIYDEVDLFGLRSGHMDIICFVEWDEDETVFQINAYYVNDEEDEIYEFFINKDLIIEDKLIEVENKLLKTQNESPEIE